MISQTLFSSKKIHTPHRGFSFKSSVLLDCKTVVFFANAGDGQYSNERSEARLERFTREDCAYGASRPPKTSKNDGFAVYPPPDTFGFPKTTHA